MRDIQIYEQLIEAGFTPVEAKDAIIMIEEEEACAEV